MRLQVENLSVFHNTQRIVDTVSLQIKPQEVLCLIGESGSGKTTLMRAIMQQAAINLKQQGKIEVNGRTFQERSKKEQQQYFGKEIGVIFQKPEQSLHPQLTIKDQFYYYFKSHTNYHVSEYEQVMQQLLVKVQLPNTKKILSTFPSQLSGGMNQRVAIAMAIALQPTLLIADEPTTALDSTIQNEIIELLQTLCREEQMSMLFITHDICLASFIGDYLIIMKDGAFIEQGPVQTVLRNPEQQYTQELIQAVSLL